MKGRIFLFLAALLLYAPPVWAAYNNGTHWVLDSSEYVDLINGQEARYYNYTYNYVTNKVDPSNCSAQVSSRDATIEYYKGLYGEEKDRYRELGDEFSDYRNDSRRERLNWYQTIANLSGLEVYYVSYSADSAGGQRAIDDFVAEHSDDPKVMFMEARYDVPYVVEKDRVVTVAQSGLGARDILSLEKSVKRLGIVMFLSVIALAFFFLKVSRGFKAFQGILDFVDEEPEKPEAPVIPPPPQGVVIDEESVDEGYVDSIADEINTLNSLMDKTRRRTEERLGKGGEKK